MLYHLLRFCLMLLSCLPWRVLYLLSDGLFYPFYYLTGYRRKIVRKNLTESFPEKSVAEIRQIEKRFYRFFLDMIFESCKLATLSPEEMRRRMCFAHTEEVNALQRAGKSVSVFIGHYGNWEWVSSMPLWLEKDVYGIQIYHKLRNGHMDRLMRHLRGRMGGHSVEMHKTARCITGLAARKQTCTVGFIADQSPRKREARHFLPFLHHSTPVLTGPEKITKHYGFEAFYLDVERTGRGRYRATFVRLHPQPGTLPDFELTARYFHCLEQSIVRQPELYLWTHNRFKHAQPSAPAAHQS